MLTAVWQLFLGSCTYVGSQRLVHLVYLTGAGRFSQVQNFWAVDISRVRRCSYLICFASSHSTLRAYGFISNSQSHGVVRSFGSFY